MKTTTPRVYKKNHFSRIFALISYTLYEEVYRKFVFFFPPFLFSLYVLICLRCLYVHLYRFIFQRENLAGISSVIFSRYPSVVLRIRVVCVCMGGKCLYTIFAPIFVSSSSSLLSISRSTRNCNFSLYFAPNALCIIFARGDATR